ncbi:AMP-binding protein [Actinomadura viridis]|uniref:Fatty-acyl-CoA synthase n=1 Tax=Actinomadura viridis TaxID=58110 RepID=A0A931DK67_9ACTN|nr:class I adenylate-forming enzyme family protein [Actinomadura viridis]MBG6091525.1 fatty-acyl-CoA synthase [Actinomadura viridis]
MPTPLALDALILERAGAGPDRPLFAFPHPVGLVPAGEFAELAGRAAASLAALGVGPGDRVAVWAENGLPWLVLLAGAAWRGATLVTLHPGSGGKDLADALRRAAPAVLFAASRIRDVPTAEPLGRLAHLLPGTDRVVAFDQDRGRDALRGLPGWDDPAPPPALDRDAPLNIQFTSGSTGPPKMVALTSASLVRNARWTAEAAGIGAADRIASPLPLAHAAGLGSGAVLALVTGALWASPRRFRPDGVLDQIVRHRCTVLQAVPTMAAMLAERVEAEPGRWDLSSLRLGFLGGAFCGPDLLARAGRALGLERVAVVYGQTEAGPTISLDPDAGPRGRSGGVGRPLPGVEVRVVRPGTETPVPAGREGELLVRSGSLAAGYADDPAATAAAFLPGGWLRTGDRARLEDGGVLVLAGRLKDLIIRGGENVGPAEVEDALLERPEIGRACVVGVPSPRWGEEVGALVVPAGDAAVDPAAVAAGVAARLARHKVPTLIRVVGELPLLPNGKVDVRAARALLAAGPAAGPAAGQAGGTP